jgi:hypothetical protein
MVITRCGEKIAVSYSADAYSNAAASAATFVAISFLRWVWFLRKPDEIAFVD